MLNVEVERQKAERGTSNLKPETINNSEEPNSREARNERTEN